MAKQEETVWRECRTSTPSMPSVKVVLRNRTPSWQRHGEGSASVEFQLNVNVGWLSVYTTEYGEKSSRTTIVTINQDSARELYALLKERFGG